MGNADRPRRKIRCRPRQQRTHVVLYVFWLALQYNASHWRWRVLFILPVVSLAKTIKTSEPHVVMSRRVLCSFPESGRKGVLPIVQMGVLHEADRMVVLRIC